MPPRTRTLQILPHIHNPFYRGKNPKEKELVRGAKIKFASESGLLEADIEVITELGMNKPFPYRLKGKIYRGEKASGTYEAEYNPKEGGKGTIKIQDF